MYPIQNNELQIGYFVFWLATTVSVIFVIKEKIEDLIEKNKNRKNNQQQTKNIK